MAETFTYNINGVQITANEQAEEKELKAYIEMYKDREPNMQLTSLELNFDGEEVDVYSNYNSNAPFERIRRITGYLVGTLDRFNDAKRAEESQRVKHAI
jgi:hypothetical protein